MRRSHLEINLDILKALRLYGPLKITHIMYKANVNCCILKERLDFLIQQNLVEEKIIGNKRTVYVITEKGTAALRHFKQLEVTMQIICATAVRSDARYPPYFEELKLLNRFHR